MSSEHEMRGKAVLGMRLEGDEASLDVEGEG